MNKKERILINYLMEITKKYPLKPIFLKRGKDDKIIVWKPRIIEEKK